MTITSYAARRYPEDWPVPQIQGHGGVIDAGMVRSQQQGFPEQWRFTPSSPTRVAMTFRMPRSDWTDWLTWVNTYAITKWVVLPYVDQYESIDPSPTYDYGLARFVGRMRMTPLGEDYVDVSCLADVYPAEASTGENAGGKAGIEIPVECIPFSCSSIEDFYQKVGGADSWTSLVTGEVTWAFPFPDSNFTVLAPYTTWGSNGWTEGTLPAGKGAPVDACAGADSRYFRAGDGSLGGAVQLARVTRTVADDQINAIVGPFGQNLDTEANSRMSTGFDFFYYNVTTTGGIVTNNAWITITSSSSLGAGNVHDQVTVLVRFPYRNPTFNGIKVSFDDFISYTSFTGVSDTISQFATVVPYSSIFPDAAWLWAPLNVKMEVTYDETPVVTNRTVGKRWYYKANGTATVNIGAVSLAFDSGDMAFGGISISQPAQLFDTFHTDPIGLPAATGGEKSTRFISSTNVTGQAIAVGGIGLSQGIYNDFRIAVERNSEAYEVPAYCAGLG